MPWRRGGRSTARPDGADQGANTKDVQYATTFWLQEHPAEIIKTNETRGASLHGSSGFRGSMVWRCVGRCFFVMLLCVRVRVE
jgi:hypothetical protein